LLLERQAFAFFAELSEGASVGFLVPERRQFLPAYRERKLASMAPDQP